jgi:hypothetical protein
VTRVLWPYASKGNWDHGLAMALFERWLWPTPAVFEEHNGPRESETLRHYDDGAVVVLSGTTMVDHSTDFARRVLDRLPWALVLHLSDEGQRWDSAKWRNANVKTWVQCPRPTARGPVAVDGDRLILQGWQVDTRELLRGASKRPVSERNLWAFRGQSFHPKREEAVAELEKRKDGKLTVTGGFSQGVPRPEYLAELAESAIAPCPSGPCTPDTFRLYEAIEAGCVPVCDRRAPLYEGHGNYWLTAIGEEPFPCVDHWSEFHAIADRFRQSPTVEMQRDANKAGAWWLKYQRELAYALLDDVRVLGGTQGHATKNVHGITVIIPTSPIPAHPSTAMIEDTVRRIRAYPELADAEILIQVDGIHPDDAEHYSALYEEYKRRLIMLARTDPGWRGVLPIVFDERLHQAEMMRRTLDLVRTPLVFYVEADTHPVNPIDVAGIARALAEPQVNMVRLHIQEGVDPEHRYMYLDDSPRDVAGVPLLRNWQWSQRPHFARTEWYRKVIAEHFDRRARCFIEDVMWGVVDAIRGQAAWERFGIWTYSPQGGPQGYLRSGHADGRGGLPKRPQTFAYDGETPPGAPAPGTR